MPSEFVSFSRISSVKDKGANEFKFSMLKPDDERVFPHMIIGDIPRKVDAEAKIFEDIHSRIKGKNVRGNLYLYTQKIPCPSCQNVIDKFNAEFPNINLKVFYGEGIKVYDSENELDKWMNIDRSWVIAE